MQRWLVVVTINALVVAEAGAGLHVVVSSRRSPFVGGNWKLNGSFQSIAELTAAFNEGELTPGVEVVIFPTMIAVDRTQSLLKNMKVCVRRRLLFGLPVCVFKLLLKCRL